MSEIQPNFLTCPAFPELPSGPETKKLEPQKRKKLSAFIWVGGVLVLALLVVLVPGAISLSRAGLTAKKAETSVKNAQQKMQALDFRGAKQEVSRAKDLLQEVRQTLYSLSYWRDVPGLGIQLRALEDASSAGAATLDSTLDLLEAMSAVLEALQTGVEVSEGLTTGIAPTRRFQDLTREEKLSLLKKFQDQLPTLRLARDKMDLALELWNRVPQNEIASPLKKAFQPLADNIPVLQRSLQEAVPLIEVLILMSGYPEPRRYLVALQNADEIRPSGGFIGSIGTVTMDAGDVKEFSFSDVYTVDNPVTGAWKEIPPEPMLKYLGVTNWYLRDANWSPDFPSSAEKVLDFYIREVELAAKSELPNRPTTYLAFEPGFFSALLRLTGPLVIDGKTFDADTYFTKLEFEVEVGFHQEGKPTEQRKEIIQKLGQELVAKLYALPASHWSEVLDVVTKALERKQVLVYSRDTELQRLLDTRNWSGRAKAADGDFLWVIDANLAALKTDGAMKKTVRYELDFKDPENPVANVTLRYTNTAKGFSDFRFTRYRSYTRIYVPEGSQLISSTGAMKDDLHKTGGRFVPGMVDVFKDLGKTVFGTFWSIEPGRTSELTFKYRLPNQVVDLWKRDEYRLVWPKQPGVDDAEYSLDLKFDRNLTFGSPSEDRAKWGDSRYEYKTDSLEDRVFTIQSRAE